MAAYFRLIACVGLLMIAFSAQATPSIQKQRIWFNEARAALKADDSQQFERLKDKLKHYPLRPYLEIWQARRQIEQGNDFTIVGIIKQYPDIPEIRDLRIAHIKNLAERGQWPRVSLLLDAMPSTKNQLSAITMLSLWYTGHREEALQKFSTRWQKGQDIPDRATRLHQTWLQQGHPTREDIWKRIGILAKKRMWKTAKDLGKDLSEKDRKLIAYWQKTQQEPFKALKTLPLNVQQDIATKMMINDWLRRLVRRDAAAAYAMISHVKNAFNADEVSKLQRKVALRAAKQHIVKATSWLAALPKQQQNAQTRAWQVRLHLLQSQWKKAAKVIVAMPVKEQQNRRWVYWLGRCLEALGKKEEAAELLAELSLGRGYFSFLSAERFGMPYQLNGSKLNASSAMKKKLQKKLGMKRAYEWWKLKKTTKARREWLAALDNASDEEWKAAVRMATSWGWHDMAIHAAFKAGSMNALSYRFPLAFDHEVEKASKESGISSSFIWSIIRQESAFNQKANSSAGARGLMQLMPKTAHQVAKENNISKGDPNLFDASINIRLGSFYLAKMKHRFYDNEAMAAAAYNAGPHRVNKWLKRIKFDEVAIWIENIPFDETRRYVQQVMAFGIVYDWLQKKSPKALGKRLQHMATAY
ncbi:MAG: transglycosylase SLT domain-containing protein [Mariprofundaceae bacterium]